MKLTREEKINILMAADIVGIKSDFQYEDYSYICSILQGEGFTQYNNLSDSQLDVELKDIWYKVVDDVEILSLAHKLNGEPIDLLKV